MHENSFSVEAENAAIIACGARQLWLQSIAILLVVLAVVVAFPSVVPTPTQFGFTAYVIPLLLAVIAFGVQSQFDWLEEHYMIEDEHGEKHLAFIYIESRSYTWNGFLFCLFAAVANFVLGYVEASSVRITFVVTSLMVAFLAVRRFLVLVALRRK